MKKYFLLLICCFAALGLFGCVKTGLNITIEFESNGGTDCNPIIYNENETSLKMPVNPTKENFLFDGWYWDNEVWQKPFTVNSVLDQPLSDTMKLTVYAKWKSPSDTENPGNTGEWTVVFDTQGGNDNFSSKVKPGTTVDKPADPIKAGYNFDGWYVKSNDFHEDNKWSFLGHLVTKDITLYAKWNIITYSIVYGNLLNGTNPNTVKSYTVEETVIFSNPQRTGYNGSWDTPNIEKGTTGNKTINAAWQAIIYNITFVDAKGGVNSNTAATYTIESETITFVNPTGINGYNGSWNIMSIPKGSMGNKTITAQWSLITYNVTYTGLQNGTHSNPSTYTIESDTITFTNASRTGYDFDGWSINNILKGSTGNKTVTAGWTAKKYIVKYNYGITEGNMAQSQKEVTFDSVFTLAVPTHTIYNFDGWYTQAHGAGAKVTNSSGGGLNLWNTPNNIDLYAYFTGTTGINYSLMYDDTYIVIQSLSELSGAVSIQPYYLGKPVTALGYYAFKDCSKITSVYIPDTVTFIDGIQTLSGCTLLTSVRLSNNMTEIPGNMFYGCTELSDIIIPDSVTSIGFGAFANCSSLTSITIPDSVSSIDGYAFSGTGIWANAPDNDAVYADKWAVGFKGTLNGNFTLKSGTNGISAYAFNQCKDLVNVTIPSGAICIGMAAFNSCTNLTSISIPASVERIWQNAFDGTAIWNSASNNTVIYADKWAIGFKGILSGQLTLESDTQGIGDIAFAGSGISSVVIPEGIKSISYLAFVSCPSLTSVTLPDSIIHIGDSAFDGCTFISIVLPRNLKTIGYQAFGNNSALKSLTIPDTVISITEFAFASSYSVTLYAETGARPDGWNSEYWNFSPWQNRPVIWGCTLSEDKAYVVSFVKTVGSIENPTAENGISAPYREGYTFGGWATTSGGTTAAYTAGNINSAPNGVTYYAIWTLVV